MSFMHSIKCISAHGVTVLAPIGARCSTAVEGMAQGTGEKKMGHLPQVHIYR